MVLKSGLAIFIAQALELGPHRLQRMKHLPLLFLERFILCFANPGSIDRCISFFDSCNNDIQILTVFVICLSERKVVERGKEIQDRDTAIAQSGSVIQYQKRGTIQYNAARFAGRKHDNGKTGFVSSRDSVCCRRQKRQRW